MKKSLFFLSLLGAIAFSSCSSDDGMGGGELSGSKETKYLSVNLVAAPGMDKAYPEEAENYEDGTEAENNVNSVRFYFFDANGNAASVKKLGDTFVNYYDWTPTKTGAPDAPNVEKTLNATIVIESPADGTKDGIPEQVVAVLNPTADVEAKSYNLSDLNEVIKDFSTTTATVGEETKSSFVMSNTVYANNKALVEAVSVKNNLYNTADAALANPVTIYVERVLAKVRLETAITEGVITLENGTKLYPTFTAEKDQEFNGEKIYAKFLGWNVTATANTSRLMKKINPEWATGLFNDSEPWNFAPYFRSFWAINPETMTYSYGSFNESEDGSVNLANAIKGFSLTGTEKNYTYVQENAAVDNSGADPTTPTKVIVAAQLVDKDGNSIEMAEWSFNRYTINGLKDALLSSSNLYKKTVSETATTFTPMTRDDIIFKTATATGDANQSTSGRYYVYAQLSDAAEGETWVTGSSEDAPEVNANNVLKALGHAKIWKSGYTYYYFDIKHLNKTENGYGKLGVVRNHLYNANIKTLVGLGTPIYDPKEVIYPEMPKEEDTYIAAEIKIVSWRLVPQDVDFNW